MPALDNPRWERFALAIFAGLAGKTRIDRAHSTAYRKAYPNCAEGHSAEVAASRLLRRVEPIMARVRELQDQLAEQTKETKEKIVAELNELNAKAQAKDAYGAAVSAVMGEAKILNLITDRITDRIEDVTNVDYNSAQSMTDIGRKLLQSIGFREPDDVSIAAAIKLNDTFIDGLQRIYQQAQQDN
jgi:dsRNA-specific ribonuclease